MRLHVSGLAADLHGVRRVSLQISRKHVSVIDQSVWCIRGVGDSFETTYQRGCHVWPCVRDVPPYLTGVAAGAYLPAPREVGPPPLSVCRHQQQTHKHCININAGCMRVLL